MLNIRTMIVDLFPWLLSVYNQYKSENVCFNNNFILTVTNTPVATFLTNMKRTKQHQWKQNETENPIEDIDVVLN